MATDFRDGTQFPRRGREALGRFLWLARVFDKARASAAGAIGDYIYPCPMDKGMLERWGIAPAEFDRAIAAHGDDAAILEWTSARTDDARIDAANAWLLAEKMENLERQDREET